MTVARAAVLVLLAGCSSDPLSTWCAPCTSNDECGGGANLCLSYSGGQFQSRTDNAFCGLACSSSDECPSHAVCLAVPGTTLRSCVPAAHYTCGVLGASGGGSSATGGGSGGGAAGGGGTATGGDTETGGGAAGGGAAAGGGTETGGGSAMGGGGGTAAGGGSATGGGGALDFSHVTQVTIGSASHAIDGVDVPRAAEQLILYTSASGAQTPTNKWGTEVVVVNDQVVSVTDRQTTSAGPVSIPQNGYVLSGHDAARDWLDANVSVGARVVLDGTTSGTGGGSGAGGGGSSAGGGGGGGGSSSCTTETWSSIGSRVMTGNCTGCHSEFSDVARVASSAGAIADKIRGGHHSGGLSASETTRVLQWLDCGAP